MYRWCSLIFHWSSHLKPPLVQGFPHGLGSGWRFVRLGFQRARLRCCFRCSPALFRTAVASGARKRWILEHLSTSFQKDGPTQAISTYTNWLVVWNIFYIGNHQLPTKVAMLQREFPRRSTGSIRLIWTSLGRLEPLYPQEKVYGLPWFTH